MEEGKGGIIMHTAKIGFNDGMYLAIFLFDGTGNMPVLA